MSKDRCAEANTDVAKRMRHCETCQVPVGTMELAAFLRLSRCKVCGGAIHIAGDDADEEIEEDEPDYRERPTCGVSRNLGKVW